MAIRPVWDASISANAKSLTLKYPPPSLSRFPYLNRPSTTHKRSPRSTSLPLRETWVSLLPTCHPLRSSSLVFWRSLRAAAPRSGLVSSRCKRRVLGTQGPEWDGTRCRLGVLEGLETKQ